MRAALAFAAALALSACLPEDRSGSVRAWVFERDEATNRYHLAVSQVDHLHSLRELSGRDIEVRRGTSITTVLGGAGFEIDEGGKFSLEYELDGDTVVPADLHSFHALTAYRNLDRVATLLREHGHAPSRPLKVYYLPRLDNPVTGDGRLLITDNAAYFSPGRAFLIVPSFVLSQLPMLLNEGVIAHEYGHAVIHQEMFGDATEEPFAKETGEEFVVLRQHLLSMHEGVADIVGFAATGDPNFIAPTAEVDRDMSQPRDMTAADLAQLESTPPPDSLFGGSGFDPHYQGSLLARAVYEAWPKDNGRVPEAERGRMLDLTLASLRALRYEPGTFTMVSFVEELVKQIPAAQRAPMCAVFNRALAPLRERIPSCRSTP